MMVVGPPEDAGQVEYQYPTYECWLGWYVALVAKTPGSQFSKLMCSCVVWSSICDFFFAIFPWLFIWSLKMPQREKIMLASGMSLGVM